MIRSPKPPNKPGEITVSWYIILYNLMIHMTTMMSWNLGKLARTLASINCIDTGQNIAPPPLTHTQSHTPQPELCQKVLVLVLVTSTFPSTCTCFSNTFFKRQKYLYLYSNTFQKYLNFQVLHKYISSTFFINQFLRYFLKIQVLFPCKNNYKQLQLWYREVASTKNKSEE